MRDPGSYGARSQMGQISSKCSFCLDLILNTLSMNVTEWGRFAAVYSNLYDKLYHTGILIGSYWEKYQLKFFRSYLWSVEG